MQLSLVREIAQTCGPRVISAAHQYAAAAGVSIFAAGGNAFDAALAACFMETVVLPMKCGLAGDFVALFRRDSGPFETIVSIGPGPMALAKGQTLERVGPRSVGVPGAPDGYAALHRFARLDLDRLITPAVAASEKGVPWSRLALNYFRQAESLLHQWSPHSPYTANGQIPKIGEMRRLPGLGQLLQQFAEAGPALFSGAAGDLYLTELRKRGGILTEEDLATRPARHLPAESFPLGKDTSLLVTPAPTSGPRLAKLAERAQSGDTDLLTILRMERREAGEAGRLALDGGTSVVIAADDEGNVVVVLHSNSFPQFGSGIVLSNGLILTNRPGRSFDLSAPVNARNAPRAGQVPPTTLHAWALERPGEIMAGATPGGINQLPWNLQTITELLTGDTPVEVVTNPRFGLSEGDEISAEPGAPLPANHGGRTIAPLSLGSAQQVLRSGTGDPMIVLAADPRSGGTALAAF